MSYVLKHSRNETGRKNLTNATGGEYKLMRQVTATPVVAHNEVD